MIAVRELVSRRQSVSNPRPRSPVERVDSPISIAPAVDPAMIERSALGFAPVSQFASGRTDAEWRTLSFRLGSAAEPMLTDFLCLPQHACAVPRSERQRVGMGSGTPVERNCR